MNDIDRNIRNAQAVVIGLQNKKIQELEAEVRLLRKLLTDAEAKLREGNPESKAVA
jgi:hypothetical protein